MREAFRPALKDDLHLTVDDDSYIVERELPGDDRVSTERSLAMPLIRRRGQSGGGFETDYDPMNYEEGEDYWPHPVTAL